MMRIAAITLAMLLMAGCTRQSSGPRPVAINTVESVSSREIMHEGVPWIDVSISQKVDPAAPAYVVGIRDSKWANRLRWALVEQSIDRERVISRFRLRPVEQTTEITLNRDDFEWYPQVSGFEPITVAVKAEPVGASSPRQLDRTEKDQPSAATGSVR